jgi:HEAT repeat protein
MNEKEKAPSFQSIVNALLDNSQEFPRRYLPYFSDMDPASLKALADAWPRVDLNRKLQLLGQLETLAEEDTLVSFDDLARALLHDPEAAIRGRAIRLLVEADDPKLIGDYVEIMNNDKDNSTRAEAATALGQFVMLGELDEIAESAHQEAETALLKIVNSETNSDVRRRALESLGFSSRLEVPTLIESAYHREDPEWIASALFAMGRSADDRWEEEVVGMLLNDEPAVQLAAVQAAGELGLTSAGPILLTLLEDEEDAGLIEAAIWSLSQIGGEDARIYIQNVLDLVEDDQQAEFLEEALENLAFTEDLERFDLLSFDRDEEEK